MSGFSTRAVRGPEGVPPVAERPLAAPIWQVADYSYESSTHYADVINERRPGQVYGRYGNPTSDALASLLADLEGGEAGWVFSSGMGAMHCVMAHLAVPGARLAVARTLYGGSYWLFTSGARHAAVSVDFFDATDPSSLEPIVKGAAGVIVESIANPTFEIAALEGLAQVCREAGVPLVVDNTVASPILCNPLVLGAELVVHSTSKYIAGHHDVIGGVVVGAVDRVGEIRHLAIRYGVVASALESYLTLRGAATMALRVERQCANALALAELLDASGKARVLYPGLVNHPQHELAGKLLRGYGGMVAADFGSEADAWKFTDTLEILNVGSSFGGVRSEVCHPATTSHRQFTPEDRAAAGITDGLIRISAGIEEEQDLLGDCERALRSI